jgi:hypothetical protein
MYMEISLKNSGTSTCDTVLVAVGNEIRNHGKKNLLAGISVIE